MSVILPGRRRRVSKTEHFELRDGQTLIGFVNSPVEETAHDLRPTLNHGMAQVDTGYLTFESSSHPARKLFEVGNRQLRPFGRQD